MNDEIPQKNLEAEKQERDIRVVEIAANLNRKKLKRDDLIQLAAESMLDNELLEEELNQCERFIAELQEKIFEVITEIDAEACKAINELKAFAHKVCDDALVEGAALQKKQQAVVAAISRHKVTYEKRQQVIEYWRKHIPIQTSNEKAGEWLHDSFPELSVRKLSEYVAQAKKELKKIPPAGKK